ncbi:hypothetical protein CAPTEDRAFT_125501 [Capitella teleta]|uniref:Uncharacterized protein n=1 Tax=Capitella teleta TaxID=283909 RepID=R7VEJ2_CAPTE|nr:hypothetical protein CAPTEDRAFT_125501 [Capitella teleta]|eukprot:ELU17248.1 hypothetical protein CAPTEDRAFT_125501 [Capitella teleta]
MLFLLFLESAAALKVEELVFNNHRLKDLATLSPHFQTYDLEVFHSLLNQVGIYNQSNYCSRVLFAVMHFNKNANRQVKITLDGTERYSIHYMKYMKGDSIVRKVKTAPMHGKLPFVL